MPTVSACPSCGTRNRLPLGQHPSGRGGLPRAVAIGVHVSTVPYPFERAADALADLTHDQVNGAAVIEVDAG